MQPTDAPARSVLLEVRDVHKRFGGLVALDGVRITVAEGELVGVIGPNGAGKTTLFHVISGFLRPDGGSMRLGGQEITGLPPHRICQLGVARTFQVVQPFEALSVLDNVAVAYLHGRLGRGATVGAAREAAHRFLGLVRLLDRAAVPASALNLSERKRLEMARALATGPRLLCLDEVMSGLTQVELELMAETVEGLQRELGLTVLMVEHNVRLVSRLCQRVVVLHYGQVIADGPPEVVMSDPRVASAYLGERYA